MRQIFAKLSMQTMAIWSDAKISYQLTLKMLVTVTIYEHHHISAIILPILTKLSQKWWNWGWQQKCHINWPWKCRSRSHSINSLISAFIKLTFLVASDVEVTGSIRHGRTQGGRGGGAWWWRSPSRNVVEKITFTYFYCLYKFHNTVTESSRWYGTLSIRTWKISSGKSCSISALIKTVLLCESDDYVN